MKKKLIYEKLPPLIKAVLLQSYGWLVGSSPDCMMATDGIPKDYDILVENRELYQEVVNMLSTQGQIKINSFGGIKYTDTQLEIDIWCEELGHYLQTCTQVGHVYNFRRSKLIQII